MFLRSKSIEVFSVFSCFYNQTAVHELCTSQEELKSIPLCKMVQLWDANGFSQVILYSSTVHTPFVQQHPFRSHHGSFVSAFI